jgi:NDP-sugar pyrophosphorylase family protein
LRHAAASFAGDAFLVLNGDSLLPNLDGHTLLRGSAAASPAPAAIAVTWIEPADRYGTVETDAQGRVTAFHEKAQRKAGWVNGGIYLATRSLVERIEPGRVVSLEHEVFPALAAEGALAAIPAPPPLLDMGTAEGLAEMEAYLRRQPPPPGKGLPSAV